MTRFSTTGSGEHSFLMVAAGVLEKSALLYLAESGQGPFDSGIAVKRR
jgi:hypothetical protein